jgi:hypothetical protein
VALTLGVVPLWFKLSLMRECRTRIEQALAAIDGGTSAGVVMRLRAALAATLLYTEKGATPEVAAIWTDVLTAAELLNDGEHRLWARWGLWNYQLNHGGFRQALSLAQHFHQVAVDPADLATGDRMVGISLHFLGRQEAARHHLEKVVERHHGAAAQGRMIRRQYDQKLAARAYLPRILWLQGFPDQAMRTAESVVQDAIAAGHALAICLALSQAACMVTLMAGDAIAAERFITLLRDPAGAHAFNLWRAESRCHEGTLLAMRGDTVAGLRMFCAGANELLDNHTGMNHTGLVTSMAGALIRSGAIAEGRALVNAALTRAERDELWCVPELLRLSGECQFRSEGPDATSAAEELFRQSLRRAKQQEAQAWMLRTATGLAGLLQQTGRIVEARTVLTEVYDRFTEGFDTLDLQAAKALIGQLAQDQ